MIYFNTSYTYTNIIKKTIFTVAAVGEMQSALNFWCLLPLLYFYDVCGIEQL